MDKRKTLLSLCSVACTGDSTLKCGANNIQQVYYTFNAKGRFVVHLHVPAQGTTDGHLPILTFAYLPMRIVPYWKVPQEDRELWQLSGTVPSDNTKYPFEQIYDGSYGLSKAYLSSHRLHAYLQIEMDTSQLVKGVLIRGKSFSAPLLWFQWHVL